MYFRIQRKHQKLKVILRSRLKDILRYATKLMNLLLKIWKNFQKVASN